MCFKPVFCRLLQLNPAVLRRRGQVIAGQGGHNVSHMGSSVKLTIYLGLTVLRTSRRG
jgi:hypothetical protein